MKRINILLVFFILIYACKEQNKDKTEEVIIANTADFSSFGSEIDPIGSLKSDEMTEKYQNLAVSDTIKTKFSAIVTVNGLAFIEEMSVDEQKHYAEDGGESEEAIAAITTPKKTYRFEADGVLVKM